MSEVALAATVVAHKLLGQRMDLICYGGTQATKAKIEMTGCCRWKFSETSMWVFTNVQL